MPGRFEKPPKPEDTMIESPETIKMAKIPEQTVEDTVVDMPAIKEKKSPKNEKEKKRKELEAVLANATSYDKVFLGDGSGFYFQPTGTGQFNLVFKKGENISFHDVFPIESVIEQIESIGYKWSLEIGVPPEKREIKKRSPEVEKNIEKFNALPEMGVIRIGDREYRKISDEFFFAGKASKNEKTAVVETVKSEDIRKEIEKAGAGKISFLESGEIKLVEDTVNDGKRRASFMKHIARYYPQLQKEPRSGVFTKIANFFTDKETKIPPTEDEIRNYIKNESMISQGTVGDCYLMAALNSFKRQRPDLYLEFISRNIMRDGERNSFHVRFPGLKLSEDISRKGWIEITDADIKKWKADKRIEADNPDLILERAYASAISRIKQGVGKTMILNEKGDMAFEGGLGHRVLHDLLSTDMAKKYEIGNYAADGHKRLADSTEKVSLAKNFLKNYAAQPKRYIVVAATPHRSEDNKEQDDTKKFVVDGESFYYRHQYSIVGYKDGKVEIENPHNTSKRIQIPEETFLKAFTQVSFAEVVGEYAAMHKKDEA